MKETVLSNLEFQDLPKDLQLMAEIIGIDAVRLLLCHLPSSTFYVPSPKSLTRLVRRYVRKNHRVNPDGTTNVRQLAVEIGVSQASVKAALRRPSASAE